MQININVMLSFVKIIPAHHLKKIASGSNGDDYNWTDVCMKNIPAWRYVGNFYALLYGGK